MDEKNIKAWIERLIDIIGETKANFDDLTEEERGMIAKKTNVYFLLGYLSSAEMLSKKGEIYE